MANQSLVIPVSVDTYTSRAYPTNTFASSMNLYAGLGVSGQTENLINASFFGFDISSIPKNDIITSMKLRVYLTNIVYYDGSSARAISGGNYSPIVVRARRLSNYTIAELSNLNYNTVNAKSGKDNVYAVNMDSNDSSMIINYKEGSFVDIPINDISKTADGLVIIGIIRDDNYLNLWSRQCSSVFASKEYNANYAPTLLVTTEDYVPQKPTNLVPNNSVRNRAGEIKLSWSFSDTLMNTTQSAYQVQYSTDNFDTYVVSNGTTDSFDILGANAFQVGATVKWKVRVTDSNGDTTDWSDVASFTIGATAPSVPEIINPTNTIVNSSDIVVFKWKFIDQYGYTQSKFDLEYKLSNGSTSIVTVASQLNQYSMPADTLSGGDYSWRVRCYNPFGEVGEYTDWVGLYSIGKPALPNVLSISNSMHPLVTWAASEQDLCIIKIYFGNTVIYNSGEQVNRGLFTVPEYINNGSYKLGIKISNIYGLWSDEQYVNFSISVSKPAKPSLVCNVNNLFAALMISSSTQSNLIYRKGEKDTEYKLIAIATSNSYTDYSVPAGKNLFYIRSVSDIGYSDSDVVELIIRFDGITISGNSDQTDLINLYQTKDSDKRKTIATTKEQYKIRCQGRTYPILQSTENKNHTESHEYFIKSDEYDTFYRIATQYDTVLYRNNYGYSFIAELSVQAIQEDVFGYIVSFTLTRLEE